MNEKNEKQALLDELDWCIENGMSGPRSKEALVAARAALAQQPQGEPRSHLRQWSDVIGQLPVSREAAPVAQGLTDEQIEAIWQTTPTDGIHYIYGEPAKELRIRFARAILAQAAPSASAQQAVSDADISAALEFMVDADSAEKMRSVCRQLRPELVAELARRRIIDAKYAPAAPVPVGCDLTPRDASKPAEQQGLFRKFDVRRTDGSDAPGGKHHGCRYFVLDVDDDAFAAAALGAYASACAASHPELARDLREKWGASPAALTDERIFALWDEVHFQTSRLPIGANRYRQQAINFARALLAASPADQVQVRPFSSKELAEKQGFIFDSPPCAGVARPLAPGKEQA